MFTLIFPTVISYRNSPAIYVERFFTGTDMPAVFTPTDRSVLRVVKYSVFQSSPPNATLVVAGWP
jgi:hypothetical protein